MAHPSTGVSFVEQEIAAVEQEIAAQLEISRIPVREQIRKHPGCRCPRPT